MKKRLTQNEEFEVMKLVLDKFLWLGFGIMAYGLYILATGATIVVGEFPRGVIYLIMGAVVLILFMVLIMKEYDVVR